MHTYLLFTFLILASLQSCRGQEQDDGTSMKSAKAHPDTANVDVKPIEIHHVGESLFKGSMLEKGKATFYSAKTHGHRTSSGERHNKNEMVCAHKTLPYGTLIRVVNENNKREVVVRVNDRGPFGKGMVIDLSLGAARELGMIGDGVVPVTLYVLE